MQYRRTVHQVCFLPFSGLKDYSPEELRWETCQAQKQGRVEGYVSGWGGGGELGGEREGMDYV